MTAQEYLNLLYKTGKEGGFPAAVKIAGLVVCQYLTDDGKRCAIGLLAKDDHLKHITNAALKSIIEDPRIEKVDGFIAGDDINLESWGNDYIKVQRCHDAEANNCFSYKQPWDNNQFMNRLIDLSCFKDCVDPRNIQGDVDANLQSSVDRS